MIGLENVTSGQRNKALWMSTLAFTTCFAVWTIFSIIGIKIKANLGLSDTQFGTLVATPVLTGSLSRIFLGVWTDKYGGRVIFSFLMVVTAAATWLLTSVTTYPMFLLAALGVGLAGGSFAVGVAYVSRWYEKGQQGTALGIFGAGNVGAAVTNFGAPILLVALGWQGVAKVYAGALLAMAVIFWLMTEDDPAIKARKEAKAKPVPLSEQLEPLKCAQVWRFAFYYFFVFGAFVALALWLPRYYVGEYGLDIKTAGMFAACYALPGSVFRALGGWMSDKFGARKVMYWTFGACFGSCFVLSYPNTRYIVSGIEGPIDFEFGIGLIPFVAITVVLGFFMSLGKAAVYKHIPVYYPDHVGSVGGMVGLVGGLGGFCLPIIFGMLNDSFGIRSSCFMLLTVIVGVLLLWMHSAVVEMDRKTCPALAEPLDLVEATISIKR
ncbi:MAG: NarK/NasA family nitrate transporter [Candidatus Melainabacteria bacterium]|nr:NarK/NasA family nitrate transporter [Candidatus Melainabacteria bacterium]